MKICNFNVGNSAPLLLIGGPCVIESYENCLEIAGKLKEIASRLELPFIFKASYDKANRTSLSSYRGPGIDKGIEILGRIKEELAIPIISDVHCTSDIDKVKGVLDVIQIPAFLCRQTDIILAAAESDKPVNVKKGQFLSPWDVKYIAEKILSSGNKNILFTERGTSFGYNNFVSDMRSIVIIKEMGFPVIYDATHSVQLPGAGDGKSGGAREFVLPLARSAVAAGCDGLFLEVHPEPENALSDSATMIRIDDVETLLRQAIAIRKVLNG